ncbi:MAG TPA: hypothetical protein DD640_02145, partial [Clostridiales bacterium]|nr:hypothetical protein [Clostridiales bacterium]
DDYPELYAEATETMDKTWAAFGNHPSWVIWSLSNECEYRNAAGNAMMRNLAQRARDMDCGRLITNVVHLMPESSELDFCDFIGLNRYYGVEKPVPRLGELELFVSEPTRKDLERLAELYPDKPIVMTEFGAVSVKGLRGEARMSEEHHGKLLEYTWAAMSGCKNLCGAVLWAWADYFHNRNFFSAEPGGMHINTPFGPYGAVTVDRRVKQAVYDALKNIFRDADKIIQE